MSALVFMPAEKANPTQAEAFLQGFFRAGETVVNGSVAFDMYKSYPAWVDYLVRLGDGREAGLGLGPPRVYFARQGRAGPLVGILDIRCQLPPTHWKWGHLGYSVAPAHRRRGHGLAMVQWATGRLHQAGINPVVACCHAGNTASAATLEKAGYALGETLVWEQDGQRYCIYRHST